MYIAGEAVRGDAGTFYAENPADGATLEPAFRNASGKQVARAAELAEDAFEAYRAAPIARRAEFLERAADEIDAVGQAAAERAHSESGLPMARLSGEVARTTGQLRLFAATLREGSWNGARIDHEQPDRKPARRPDVRTRRVPLGKQFLDVARSLEGQLTAGVHAATPVDEPLAARLLPILERKAGRILSTAGLQV